ncbi:mycofactocin-coupled SDR family oxidoreductase [Trebonia sp.]|uniref:mycofactocin-coupled SDR family oxidoreductase n=1 Tax=Trebonia sp. TaxID=2767075 RepID=UPI0026290744|nr:mycofactocin-coupled SDR family oxidoreductase [Trebonia sp.]
MGLLNGKVAFVTGAARGQGRSHARRLAEEGADIIAIDACATQDWLTYPLATEADLAQTVKEVEAFDRRIIARRADVRDLAAVRAVLDEGVAALGGRLDIVCANAAIISQPAPTWEIDVGQWRELIDVTLTGVFVTVKAAIPHMIAAGNGGSIALTSSGAALISGGGLADYKAAKAGVLSLTRTLACELAEHFIRVNAICPTAVDTPMIQNEALYRSFRPDLDNPGREDVKAGFQTMNLLPIPWVDPVDVSNAIVWLASDAARYVTGITLPVDAGNQHK